MIYFAEALGANRIKIGFTADEPQKRVAALGQCAPFKVELICSIPGGKTRERQLHAAFASDRQKGEWFRASHALRSFVKELSAQDDAGQVRLVAQALRAQEAHFVERREAGAAFAGASLDIARDCIRRCAAKHSVAALAEGLARDQSTVRYWMRGGAVPSFDAVAAMAKADPESFALLREHFQTHRAEEAPTIPDRLGRIERELDAIRRESA